MQTGDNTILITGGGSGIGRGLAESFHSLGNRVIISGRRRSVLDETTAANPGMASLLLDVENGDAIRAFATTASTRYPGLNVLINNAGIMRAEDLREQPGDVSTAEATIRTNLLGPIRLTAALLPLLMAQPRATIINVSSGLAFVPRADSPTYCATKAAIHSLHAVAALPAKRNVHTGHRNNPSIRADGHGWTESRSPSHAHKGFHRRDDANS